MEQPPSAGKPADHDGRSSAEPDPGAPATGNRLGSLHVRDEAAVAGQPRQPADRPLESVHQPTGNRYGGYGGLRDPGDEAGADDRPQRHDDSAFDREYLQWRDEQLRRFDQDYRSWRGEGNQRFNATFEQWRGNRQPGATAANHPADRQRAEEDVPPAAGE